MSTDPQSQENPTPTPSFVTFDQLKQIIEPLVEAVKVNVKQTPTEPNPVAPTAPVAADNPIIPTELSNMLRELTIRAYNVPEELQHLLPEDPTQAAKVASSPNMTKLIEQLSLVSKPAAPTAVQSGDSAQLEDGPKPGNTTPENSPTAQDGDRNLPEAQGPKTFGDITSEFLQNALREVV